MLHPEGRVLWKSSLPLHAVMTKAVVSVGTTTLLNRGLRQGTAAVLAQEASDAIAETAQTVNDNPGTPEDSDDDTPQW